MAVLVNEFYEVRLEQLLNLADTVEKIFAAAELDYRVVGGVATYLYVEEAAPDAGRLTRDVDILVRREDLEKIAAASEPFGFWLSGGMLVQLAEPNARRAVHLIFGDDEVRFGDCRRIRGIRLIPLADLIQMKLTSNRLKDGAHIIDLDEAGLITPQIEAGLPPVLRERLAEARARG